MGRVELQKIQFQRETKLCDYYFKKCKGLTLYTIFKQIPSSFLTPLNTNKKNISGTFQGQWPYFVTQAYLRTYCVRSWLFYQEQLKEVAATKKVPLPPPLSSNHFWGFTQVFYFAVLLNSVRVRVCVIFGSIICVCGLFCWLRFSYCLRFHTKKNHRHIWENVNICMYIHTNCPYFKFPYLNFHYKWLIIVTKKYSI